VRIRADVSESSHIEDYGLKIADSAHPPKDRPGERGKSGIFNPQSVILRVVIVLIVMCIAPTVVAAVERKDSRPNIVLIVADDLGYADLGVQGSSDIPTPSIDALVRGGVRFTDAYVTAPVCSPSRAGLLTGRYQNRFGHEFNPGWIGRDLDEGIGLDLDEKTLAEILKGAGYATGLIGKWHLGADPRFIPEVRGFDDVFGTHGGYHAYIDPKTPGVHTVRGTPYLDRRSPETFVLLNPIWRDGVAVCEPRYLTDAFSREAVRFINDHHDEPFFLYLPYTAVHTPLQATDRYYDQLPGIDGGHRRVYGAMVLALDSGIGRVLAALDGHGLSANTLVVFLSDNGGALQTEASTNTPLAGGKHYLLEGGIRVPMAVRFPGRVRPGTEYDRPVISLDLTATILAAADVEPSPERPLDGVDLVPFLTGDASGSPHEALFWRSGEQRAARRGDWKLVEIGDHPLRLHDLAADIGERHNLAAEHPEIVRELELLYAAWEAQMIPPRWTETDHGPVAEVEAMLSAKER
jgi:arylsulfatase A-like enzyme